MNLDWFILSTLIDRNEPKETPTMTDLLRPMTRAELVRELHAVTVLLPRILPTSPQARQTRRDWSAHRKALVAEIARRSAFNLHA